MANEPTGQTRSSRQTAPLIGAGRPGFILSALNHLRGIQPAGGKTPGTSTVARQKESLCEWARGLGLLLNADSIIPRLGRGGQEHDIFAEEDRVIKVTRNGVFGFAPGIVPAPRLSGARIEEGEKSGFAGTLALPYRYLIFGISREATVGSLCAAVWRHLLSDMAVDGSLGI